MWIAVAIIVNLNVSPLIELPTIYTFYHPTKDACQKYLTKTASESGYDVQVNELGEMFIEKFTQNPDKINRIICKEAI